MDLYEALIGDAPSTPEALRALAGSLRRKQQAGMLAQLTGDRVLAPMGPQLSDQVANETRQLQQTRQSGLQRTMQQKQFDANYDLNNRQLQEQIRANRAREANAASANALRMSIAQLKANAKPGKGFNYSQQRDVRKMVGERDAVNRSASSFQDSFAGGLPGVQSARNFMGSFDIASQDMKNEAAWWAEWDKYYTLGARNQLFGATLTPNEQEAWKNSNISPGMDPDEIRKRLAVMQNIADQAISRERNLYGAQGYDPNVLEAAFGSPGSLSPGVPPQGGATGDPEIDALTERLAELEAELNSGP